MTTHTPRTTNEANDVDRLHIHTLYRKAIAADEHYSKVLDEFGASRWESRTTRSARSGRAQFTIREAYQAKVDADRRYQIACAAAQVGY